MKVKDLIEALKCCDQDAEVQSGYETDGVSNAECVTKVCVLSTRDETGNWETAVVLFH